MCLGVWSAFIWWPEVRDLLWGGVTVLAGFAGGIGAWQALAERRVRQWTKDVLIPAGREAGIDFEMLLSVLEDAPEPGPYSEDAMRSLKEHETAVRDEIIEAGGVPRATARGHH